MDEALAEVAIDCGGRAYLVFDAPFSGQSVGGIDVTLVPPLLRVRLPARRLHGSTSGRTGGTTTTWPRRSSRPFGVALRSAVALEPGDERVPSTKGVF